ncbi:MAG: transcription antitermination factor NusB [Blastochloris sp.]|jgi:N utilization substance protein B|nr:transcription antitermination factor NusB [Blastochloris sp.]
MGKRRDGRVLAVQYLYQHEVAPKQELTAGLALFMEMSAPEPKVRDFALPLIHGVIKNALKIDETLKKYSDNWEMERMAPVDKNILRLAVYEMNYCPEVPPVVAINEAIEVAKFLSSHEAGKFVNGILDRVRKDLDRPAREGIRPEGIRLTKPKLQPKHNPL